MHGYNPYSTRSRRRDVFFVTVVHEGCLRGWGEAGVGGVCAGDDAGEIQGEGAAMGARHPSDWGGVLWVVIGVKARLVVGCQQDSGLVSN